MSRKKQRVNTSWAGQYAREASNRRTLDEIANYDADLQIEQARSADRNARLLYDIELTRADIKFLEEDPEGYFYEKEQRELENKPHTLGDYWKNFWNSHGRRMNEFQMDDALGYMDRADQWERLANDVNSYLDVQEKIENIDSQLKQLRLDTQNINKMPADQIKNVYGAIDMLEAQKSELQENLKQLQPSVDAFKSYTPNAIMKGYYDIVAGNGESGVFSDNTIFGRTTQAHDELGDITRFTYSMFAPNRTRAEQRNMLKLALEAKKLKYEEWKTIYDENAKDRDSYDRVDRWFKKREDASGTDIFDANTWKYGMPGLIAGTTSGASKIVPSMLIGLGTSAAVAATGGVAGALIGAAGYLGTFGLNQGAGAGENNAEVAMAYTERLKEALKEEKGFKDSLYDEIIKEGRDKLHAYTSLVDDDEIFRRWRRGDFTVNNAKVNRKLELLAIGIESLFQDDMMATTFGSAIESALQVMPLGQMISPSKLLRFKTFKTGIGKQLVRNGEALAEGFEIGSAISPIAGPLIAPIHMLISPAVRKSGKLVSGVVKDIAKAVDIVDTAPESVLRRKFASSTRNKYIKDITGRWLLASSSEGIEEGKLRISSDRYKNGYYTDAKIKSIGDTVLDDFLAGSKSAALLLGMPFEGVLSEKDRSILQEIKGGFLLGGLQTAMINVSTSIYPYKHEQSATKAIVNSALRDKAAKLDRFKKALVYASAAGSQSSYENLMDGFRRLRELNDDMRRSTGEWGVLPKAIDDEEKEFKKTTAMSVDGYTIKQAEAQGISRDSKEYPLFIAAKTLAENELNDANDVAKAAAQEFTKVLTELMLQVLTERLQSAMENTTEEESTPSPAAKFSSDQNFKQLLTVAEYAALLRRRDELELGIVNAESGNHKTIKKILNKKLQEVNDKINNMKTVIESYKHGNDRIDISNLESVENNLVLDKDSHDKLSSAYRNAIVADQDYAIAEQQYTDVIGTPYIDGKEVDTTNPVKWDEVFDKVEFKNGKAKQVIKQIQDTIDDDDDLMSAIDRDFEQRTDDEGNEVITEEQAENLRTEVPVTDPEAEFKDDVEKNRRSEAERKNPTIDTFLNEFAPETDSQRLKILEGKHGNDKYDSMSERQILKALKDNYNKVQELKNQNDSGAKIAKLTKDSKLLLRSYYKKQIAKPVEQEQPVIPEPVSPETGQPRSADSTPTAPETLPPAAPTNADLDAMLGPAPASPTAPVTPPPSTPEPTTPVTPEAPVAPEMPSTPPTQPTPPVVPPAPPTPPTAPETPQEEPEMPEAQRKTLEALNAIAEESKLYVKAITPKYYLIEVNGEEIQMPRVHSVMPQYWADYDMFMPALQVGNLLDNLARIFFSDKNNMRKYRESIASRDALIDSLWNEYASNKNTKNDPSVNKLTKLYYKDIYTSKKEFAATIHDLYMLAEQYDRLGWVLSTEPIVWYNKFNRGWVAGETDMVAVDREGKVHIIDFKTSHWKKGNQENVFGHFEINYSGIITPDVEELLSTLNKEDFTVGPRGKGLSKKAREVIHKIRMHGVNEATSPKEKREAIKNNRQLKVVWDDTLQQAVLHFMGSAYTALGGSFRVSHDSQVNGERRGSKLDEYSDQLTAYMEMIKNRLANVTGLEVIGFRAEYQYDEDANDLLYVTSIRNSVKRSDGQYLPFKVSVSESQEMKHILNMNVEAPPVAPQPPVGPDPAETAELNESSNTVGSQTGGTTFQDPQTPPPAPPAAIVPAQEAPTAPATVQPGIPPASPAPAGTVKSYASKPGLEGYHNLNVNNLNPHRELAEAMALNANFVSDMIANGGIELYTEIVSNKPTVYADITYNGTTYKRIFVYDPNGQLYKKVKDLEDHKTEGQKIVATHITRDAGKVEYGEDKPVLQTSLIDEDVNTVRFESTDLMFGFVKDGLIMSFRNGDTHMPDKIGSLPGTADGTFIYMKRCRRSTSEGADRIIPIAMRQKTLENDADFIIDCLRNIQILDMPYIMKVGNNEVSIGATRRELLGLLIPFTDDYNRAPNTYSIIRDPNVPTRFGIIDRNKKLIVHADLRDPAQVNNFKEALKNVQLVDQHDILASTLANAKAAPVFNKIYKFFASNREGIRSINLSDTIKFDFEDFRNGGISGMAWYLKRGAFTTNYDYMSAPMMSINDVAYKDNPPTPPSTPKGPETPTIEPFEPLKFNDISNDPFAVQWKKLTEADKNKPKLTEQAIKKHLRPLLGNAVDDPTVLRIITTIANDPAVKNAAVVGKATVDGITLYADAFDKVDYHEAFHRIFELFIPEGTRDAVYEKAAKRLGIDLSESTKANKYAGHRQVAEWLADKFMEHRRYNISSGIVWLDRVINTIIDFARAIFNLGQFKMMWTFMLVNNGWYAKGTPSKRNMDRFNELFGLLNYEIHGQKFEHIANDPMYEELKNTAVFCLLRGQRIDTSGSTIQEMKVDVNTFKKGAETLKPFGFDIFGTDVEPTEKNPVQLAMSEMAVKFDAISDDLAARISSFSTDYRKIMQDEGREDADGGEAMSSYDEDFFKWSYEFDRFDKTTSRVKFFFATIPDSEWNEDKTGRVFKLNSLGLPQFIPMNYVFNDVLSNLWDVDTIEEAIYRLSLLGMEDPMYAQIATNLQAVSDHRVRPDGTVDADKEALLAQLMNTIRSNRHLFMLLRSVSNAEGRYDIVIQRSDADYNAKSYTLQWSQVLSKGGTPTLKVDRFGKVIFNPENVDAIRTFKTIARFFNQIKDAVSSANGGKGQIIIPRYQRTPEELAGAPVVHEFITDLTDAAQCKRLKECMVDAFNRIGINIHLDELNYMLRNKYGAGDWEGIRDMVQSTEEYDSMGSFMFFLNNITAGGKLNITPDGMFVRSDGSKVSFDNVYSEMAFVKELGNWKYEYRHSHDQLSVLATGGNRFYEMSDNDYMSDVLRNLNKRGKWFVDLKNDPYNYYTTTDNFGEELSYGSITLQQLTENPEAKLQLKHFIGFKTDKKLDEGRDYFEISRREDYLAKMGILENGGMISLTLSDKKKYCYIQGVKLPGLDYTTIMKSKTPVLDLSLALQRFFRPDEASSEYNIQQLDSVVTQFLSYATTEYQSILRNADSIAKSPVANFDDKKQGLRFSSLLGVWENTYDREGKVNGEQFISFNDGRHDWEDDLHMAEIHFFDKPIEEQKALIARNLTKQTERELKNLVDMGLIKQLEGNPHPYLAYYNAGLNNRAIEGIKMAYLNAYKNPNTGQSTLSESQAESMAIVIYVNDISNKAIMSGQEMERLFSGNPAFYKWKYNSEGQLVDRTVDELKRLGGLGSTGNNNFTQLKDIPKKYLDKHGNFTGKYVAAEVDNEMVSSPLYQEMADRMYEGQLRQDIIDTEVSVQIKQITDDHEKEIRSIRQNYADTLSEDELQLMISDANRTYNTRLMTVEDDVTGRIDAMSVEEMEKTYPGLVKASKERAAEVSNALKKDIDVADGGAYISDEMCELLLRMEGAYSKEIQEAFSILRGETEADYLSLIDAYLKVLTSVIGNQKYTAFGRRLQNGVSVPYYHKMALFPIFECIATGKMRNVFDKMKEQGIDMLLVNSAVKVGSEGSKPIKWDEYRQTNDPSDETNFKGDIAYQNWKPMFKDAFNFYTYECEFDYLRKQLNTDPKEETLMRMGTQMQKVVYSNLMPGRTYTTQHGESITGRKLLERIMQSSNKLSDIGVDKMNQRFFKTNENGQLIDRNGYVIEDTTLPNGEVIPARNSDKREIDIVKFSKEVSKLMSDRGADKNVLKALEVVTTAAGNELSVPLGAISNANWLESTLISTINKEVIDVNTPGAFFIQRSVWAMEGQKMFDGKKSIKGDEDPTARRLYNGKRLQMVNSEGSMDCVLSLDFYKNILPQIWTGEYETDENGEFVYERDKGGNLKKQVYGKPAKPDIKTLVDYAKNNGATVEEADAVTYILQRDWRQRTEEQKAHIEEFKKKWESKWLTENKGQYVPKKKMRDMTFTEAHEWLIEHDIIGENAKASIVAYRIPTQAESSIHALRCVDVLPVVRDTVILPLEFTKITGSDFDIDKLGLSTVNWKRNGSDQFEVGSERYYQNQLIRDYITLLIDPKTQHILHRSIDNDTKLLKDVLKEIESNSAEQEMPYQFYSLSTQTERKDDYITGKIGIGPFALNNNSHILTMLYDVHFKNINNSIMSTLGLTSLATRKDRDGNSVMSWLSALINAHVDIAKDPYISRLNVNSFTYNLVNTLIRTGFGKNTFYFTTQPIMKELAKAYVNASSSYMADQYKSQFQLQKEAVEEVANNRFKDVKLIGHTFEEILEGISDPEDKFYKPIINKYIKKLVDDGILRRTANSDYNSVGSHTISSISGEGTETLTGEQIQMLVYLAYKQFDPYALSVSSLVKYSKIDTKKHGKSYVEQQVFLKGFKNLFDPEGENSGLFEEAGLIRMAKQSYIELKTYNAISMTKNILKGQFLQATNAFDNAIRNMLNLIGKPDSLSVDLWNTVSRAIMASIKSEFINDYASKLPQYYDTYMHDLVSESEGYVSYEWPANSNRIKLDSPKHNPKSYLGTTAYFFTEIDGTRYTAARVITGYDDETGEVIVDKPSKGASSGQVYLMGGKNTIYDRFNDLMVEMRTNPEYSDILTPAGEPYNMLLRSLVPGNTFEYVDNKTQTSMQRETPDTYRTLKFIKLFNAFDQNGVESNFIIDAWDQLLHDNDHPKLKRFAEDLVVYAFITSGDQGGFTKFFKQVPFSWRKESGYGDFIAEKLVEFQSEEIGQDQLEDAILNNWFENTLVPKYNFKDNKGQSNFISYTGGTVDNVLPEYSFPTVLAALKSENGILKPSIDPDKAPLYIKVPRRNDKDAKDSQRRVTVYRRISYGMRADDKKPGKWIHFPIYAKVEPKGNLIRGNYLITEYGREDSTNKEYEVNEDSFKSLYQLSDFIEKSAVTAFEQRYGSDLAQLVEDMNYRWMLDTLFGGNEKAMNKELIHRTEVLATNQTVPDFYTGKIEPVDDVIFVFGSNPEGRHGAGAAKTAVEKFGAIYGQGEGLQGNSYALPTKDLRVTENRGFKSISPEQITENIKKMYEVARLNPDKTFKVAYTNGANETTLNGYTGREMVKMFIDAGNIPENVQFSENWESIWYEELNSRKPVRGTDTLEDPSNMHLGIKINPNAEDVTMHYGEWKRFLANRIRFDESDNSINQFEILAEDVADWFEEAQEDYPYTGDLTTYDKNTKSITINGMYYDALKQILDNAEDIKKLVPLLTHKFELADLILQYDGNINDLKNANINVLDINEQFGIYVNNELSDERRDDEFVRKIRARGYYETTSDKLIDYLSTRKDKIWISETLALYVHDHPTKVVFSKLSEGDDPDVGGRFRSELSEGKISKDRRIIIYVDSKNFEERPLKTIYHEIAHSQSSEMTKIFLTKISDGDRKFLNGVIEYAKRYINENVDFSKYLEEGFTVSADSIYGLLDPYEFVAEMLSNKNFIRILRAIPAMEKNEFRSLFDDIIDWITKFVKRIIGDSSDGTLFRQIEPVVQAIVEAQDKLDYTKSIGEQFDALIDESLKSTIKRPSKESRQLYNLTEQVKSAISSRLITALNRDGISRDDVEVSRQAESINNGKYVIVKLKQHSKDKFDKLVRQLKTLEDGKSDYNVTVDGNRVLIKNVNYSKFDTPVETKNSISSANNISYLYYMIQNEPSYEHAESIMDGYRDAFDESDINEALGIYYRLKCKMR